MQNNMIAFYDKISNSNVNVFFDVIDGNICNVTARNNKGLMLINIANMQQIKDKIANDYMLATRELATRYKQNLVERC